MGHHDKTAITMGVAAALALALAFTWRPVPAQEKLELQKALPLDGPDFIQPSGLAMAGNSLLMVSAAQDESIFEIQVGADKAVYKETVKIKRPKETEGQKLGWRGIASDGRGDLFLAGGPACRIMHVTSGGKAEWLGPSLLEAGVEKGLFAGENSGVEGLVRMGEGKFLVAASRDPRGLLQLDLTGGKTAVRPFLLDKSHIPLGPGRRQPDFTDLSVDKGQAWALESAADAVCRLDWKGQEYSEGEYFTFGHVTNDVKYRYLGLKMGLARGLAMDANSIYVVLDNKGVSRQIDPSDKRALLLVFKRPR